MKIKFSAVAVAAALFTASAIDAQVGRQTLGPIDLDAATAVNGSLGVAELGGIAFVSSRGNNGGTAAPHSLTAIDLATNAVLNIAQQTALADSSAWGYRDGTSDGSVLMFAYDAGVEVIDPGSALSGTGRVTNVTTVMADNGPQTITNPINAGPTVTFHRGLAYNPSGNGGNGSLWTASFGSDLWEIDLNGNVLTTWPLNGWSVYGLAWDHQNGTLWCNSAPTNGPLAEIDPATGTLTGRTIARNGPATAQGGLSWVAGGFDGRNCGADLLGVDQATPDTLNGYRLQLWDTLSYNDERELLFGSDGGALAPGDLGIGIGASTLDIDLSGTPGAAYSAFVNLDPAASVAQPVPNPIGAIFPSLWELAVDISAGTLVNITPLVSGAPVNLPLAGFGVGDKFKLQAISINFGVIGGGNPCGLALGVEVSQPNCVTITPAQCGVTASANGTNSFNSVTTSGYFSVLNQTGLDITALTIDAQPLASTLRFDTDQGGMADRFDAGISTAAACQNTYRNGSDAATGLVYAGTRLSPGCSGTEIGWNGTAGAATIANDFQVLDFTFTDFNNGETFEFDCDTDGGPGINGNAMAGMIFTVTLSDGTVCTGALVADPGNTSLSQAIF